MTNYELHPLCTLFPRMAGAEFAALVADIKANGQREPIILHDGMILDGGNRYRACIEASVEPQFMQFGGGNLVAYVLSANLHRRHMTAGQQAAIVASAQDWAKSHAPHREKGAILHPSETDTVSDRATQSGASHRTQQMADKVAREAPELAKKVAQGEVSLPAAVEQITGKRPGAKKPEPEPDDDFGPSDEEIRAAQKEEADELASLRRIGESDDQIAAALAEAKRFRELNRVLESRINGLLNEKNEAIRQAKMWQRKFERLEKLKAAA